MTHAHITAWVVALILFFVAVSLQRGNSPKARMMQMILRLFYLIIIGTGALLLYSIATIPPLYIVKALVGIWVIGAMEMILVRAAKGKSTNVFWIQFVIAFIIVLYLGFTLPLGFDLF
ncbi:YisL family protein [Bacillus alveayuensis]|uniref:YisL family protein n=1 Tax=Aeribacillus alveayuensis TaxID=279215 RepID=UPI0005CD5F1A|nr:YisL family protein [Bacillus alveayuensis]